MGDRSGARGSCSAQARRIGLLPGAELCFEVVVVQDVTAATVGTGAAGTAVAFAEAGALCMPAQARYALVAGRVARTYGRHAKAEEWLTRAAEIARVERDWETLALSLSSLGSSAAKRGTTSVLARRTSKRSG
jgi:hypothetical protein